MKNYLIKAASWPADKALLKEVRSRVFIEEQQVPIELEWDEYDEDAMHWLAFDTEQQQSPVPGQTVDHPPAKPIGTCRMLSNGHIGRMAVLKQYRGQGIGRMLLDAAINQAKNLQLFEVYLHAQTHAITFYQTAGFITHGGVFLDANIEHSAMKLQLAERRLLGVHGGKFAVPDYANSALELISQAKRHLRILSFDLDHNTFNTAAMAQAISQLARHSRYTQVRILVADPAPLIKREHRLLTLHRRLSSNILLRKSNAAPHEFKENLIIADQLGLICQSIREPESAWGNYNNKPITNNYIAQFDDLWERGSEDKNFRQLGI